MLFTAKSTTIFTVLVFFLTLIINVAAAGNATNPATNSTTSVLSNTTSAGNSASPSPTDTTTSTATVNSSSTVPPISTTSVSSNTISAGNSSSPSQTNTTTSSATVSTVPPTSTTVFSFNSCSDCNSLNITQPSSQSQLILCCDSFSKCCFQANQIKCPTTSSSGHRCNKFGSFCSNNNNCSFGSICCKSTDTINVKCCWTPR